jgi:hypothetical protein
MAVPDKKIIGLERMFGADHILIVLNFEKSQTRYSHHHLASAAKIFDSSAKPWLLDLGPAEPTSLGADTIVMNSESVSIFELAAP